MLNTIVEDFSIRLLERFVVVGDNDEGEWNFVLS